MIEPTPTTTIDLLRHGEPVGGRRYRGHKVDDALSELGWRQMRLSTRQKTGWQAIVTSPLLRCSEFADWLGAELRLPVTVIPDLREVGFGSWEGRAPAELPAAELEAFLLDPVRGRPPGAEPLAGFADRVSAAYGDVIRDHAGQHVLLVAHAGVIRAILGHVLQAPPATWYRIRVDNASLTRCRHDRLGHALLRHNWLPQFD